MAADASFRKAVMAASGQCAGGLAVKTNGIWRRSDIFYSGFSFFQRGSDFVHAGNNNNIFRPVD